MEAVAFVVVVAVGIISIAETVFVVNMTRKVADLNSRVRQLDRNITRMRMGVGSEVPDLEEGEAIISDVKFGRANLPHSTSRFE